MNEKVREFACVAPRAAEISSSKKAGPALPMRSITVFTRWSVAATMFRRRRRSATSIICRSIRSSSALLSNRGVIRLSFWPVKWLASGFLLIFQGLERRG